MADSKVILITGSSSGIGRGTAHLFASKGFRVVVHGSTSKEKVDKVVDECNKLAPTSNHTSIGIVADFKNPNNGALLVNKAIEHFGRLDAVITCAGVWEETDIKSPNCYQTYELVRDINLNSHIQVLITASPYLLKAKNASIVIISDITVEQPTFKRFAHTMGSATLRSLACCLAVELGPNVRALSVSLGEVFTPQHEKYNLNIEDLAKESILKRCASIDEIAKHLWHLSQEASYITGADIRIDGGYRIKSRCS